MKGSGGLMQGWESELAGVGEFPDIERTETKTIRDVASFFDFQEIDSRETLSKHRLAFSMSRFACDAESLPA